MTNLRRYLIVPLMLGALALAGCASLPQISRTTLYQAKAAYGTVLAGALAYGRSCERRVLPPSCWDTVEVLQSADRVGQQAILAGDVLQIMTATTNLQQVKAERGVK